MVDFSEELKVRTKDVHSTSDKLFNSVLNFALADRKVYRMAVYRFYHVFLMIEDKLEDLRHDNPALQMLYFPTLFRANEFEEDVQFFFPEGMPEELSPVLKQYKDTLEQHTSEDPTHLIGYLQTMQLAILSGGHLLRPVIVKVLGLKENYPLGVKGLDWPEGFNSSSAKKMYAERLNSLDLSRAQKDAIVGIKREVFAMNNRLIREVSHSPEGKATVWWFIQRVLFVVMFVVFIMTYLYLR